MIRWVKYLRQEATTRNMFPPPFSPYYPKGSVEKKYTLPPSPVDGNFLNSAPV